MARPSDLIVIATVAAGAVTAAVIDLRTRRVPNALTLAIAAVGIVFGGFGIGGATLAQAALGMVFGLVLMLPGHAFGRTGAGDVKLFAALGGVVGPGRIFSAFFYTALAGGLLAVVVAVRRGRLRQTVGDSIRLVAHPGGKRGATSAPGSTDDNNSFAFAPAIAVGVVMAAFGL